METRLGQGAWAVASDGDVHLGALIGDMQAGWHSRVAVLPTDALPGIVRRLNLGGVWSDGEVSIQSAGGVARIVMSDGPHIELDDAATARLQIFCAHVSTGREWLTHVPLTSAVLDSDRGSLRVHDVRAIGRPLALARVSAGRDGAVHVDVPTTAGPLRFGLPALQVLVAGNEAVRDGNPLRVTLPTLNGEPALVRARSAESAQAAAEAQWLMPAFRTAKGPRPGHV